MILQSKTSPQSLLIFPLQNSNVQLLPIEFGISQVNIPQVYFSWNLNRFAVFGLAHKHLTKFGVVKATFDVCLGKNGFFKVFWIEAL